MSFILKMIQNSQKYKNKKVAKSLDSYFFMVIQEGFEPPTHGLEIRCSIQLSY